MEGFKFGRIRSRIFLVRGSHCSRRVSHAAVRVKLASPASYVNRKPSPAACRGGQAEPRHSVRADVAAVLYSAEGFSIDATWQLYLNGDCNYVTQLDNQTRDFRRRAEHYGEVSRLNRE